MSFCLSTEFSSNLKLILYLHPIEVELVNKLNRKITPAADNNQGNSCCPSHNTAFSTCEHRDFVAHGNLHRNSCLSTLCAVSSPASQIHKRVLYKNNTAQFSTYILGTSFCLKGAAKNAKFITKVSMLQTNELVSGIMLKQ